VSIYICCVEHDQRKLNDFFLDTILSALYYFVNAKNLHNNTTPTFTSPYQRSTYYLPISSRCFPNLSVSNPSAKQSQREVGTIPP
jgi:hypothetical protein